MRMEHLLYLLLLHSVCHLLQWVGMTNLNYGKAKKLKVLLFSKSICTLVFMVMIMIMTVILIIMV